MGAAARSSASLVATLLFGAAASGCGRAEQRTQSTYYEREIAPILVSSCSRSATGSDCHVTADYRGNALGNLDVTSYEMLTKRRDLLLDYGPYGMPQLLVKVVPPFVVTLGTWDGTSEQVTIDVPHAGGSLLDVPSVSFTVLERWLERGAAENNAPPARQRETPDGPCSPRLGNDASFQAGIDPPAPDFELFVATVNPILTAQCASGNCHGAAPNPLYLTCGETPEQIRWNYFAASDYVASDPSGNELLRRTLAPEAGGTYHQGGAFFDAASEPGYQAILDWSLARGIPANVPEGPGFEVFVRRVQPVLAKKGCMLLGCHSQAAFNELHLNAGSAGHLSLAAARRNYAQVTEFVAFESVDPTASRLLRKNLAPPPSGRGILHRGGPLLERDPEAPACDRSQALSGPLDAQDPYCVLAAWIGLEHEQRSPLVAPLSGVVYVSEPARERAETPQDFEHYQPGSDLRWRAAHLDELGKLVLDADDRSLLPGCGLEPSSAHVRRPQVAWDGRRVAFAARTSASEPYRVYVMNPDGSECAVEPTIDAPATAADGSALPTNGELVHNFDPSFAADGSLVFASTRGNLDPSATSYRGPQRTPADPSKLNANLYVLEGGRIRQLTFLLNQEILPSFKSDGQLVFSAEKRVPGFYQLAGRRINLDGGDYHPLFGQRPTMGYTQLTDLVQLADLNFAAILSDRGALGSAGALAVINRSLGPDTASSEPLDYVVDPGLQGWADTPFFQHSLRILDPVASGRVAAAVEGAYRNPMPLPNGEILVSHAPGVTNMSRVSGFDVVVVDPVSGERRPLAGLADPLRDEIWPVAVYGRSAREVLRSTPADPTGSAVVYPEGDAEHGTDRAELTFLDLPLIASLMFQNTRGGRRIVDGDGLEVWESLPPQAERSLDAESPFIVEDAYGKVYARRRLLGRVPLLDDGSTRLQVPGGMPLVFGVKAALAGESEPGWHQQREEGQYYPGEWVTLSFRRQLFDGFCGGCHGSVSGLESDVAVDPDILSSASSVMAKQTAPSVLVGVEPGPDLAPPYP